ncbi:hypothetical protein DPMN_180768, partial [Dreissena polymorpha]
MDDRQKDNGRPMDDQRTDKGRRRLMDGQQLDEGRPMDDRWTADGRPMDERWTTDGRPMDDRWTTDGRPWSNCWPSIGRPLSALVPGLFEPKNEHLVLALQNAANKVNMHQLMGPSRIIVVDMEYLESDNSFEANKKELAPVINGSGPEPHQEQDSPDSCSLSFAS